MTESFCRVRQILFTHWDPIRINHLEGAPEDEYDSYIPKVLGLLATPNAAEAIAEYLCYVEESKMSLSPDPDRAKLVAKMCIGQTP